MEAVLRSHWFHFLSTQNILKPIFSLLTFGFTFFNNSHTVVFIHSCRKVFLMKTTADKTHLIVRLANTHFRPLTLPIFTTHYPIRSQIPVHNPKFFHHKKWIHFREMCFPLIK